MNAPPLPPDIPVGPYVLRPVTPRYRELIEQAVSADPFHVGRVDPEFFATAGPGEQCWALEDEKGYVVFFLKTQVACRLHIQFGPAATAVEKARNRDAMILGVEWMEGVLQASGYREMIFDTANPLLASTATRRLGFERCVEDYRRAIPYPSAPEASEDVLRGEQKSTEEVKA